MKTTVYIDGFNLYHGALKGTSHKWLDLRRMCELILPNNDIAEIKYFTARIAALPGNQGAQLRQQVYLRAIQTLPGISIHYGSFMVHNVMRRLADPSPGSSPFVRIIKIEEKGSDVNLASHLVHDAHQQAFETAVVVTNDSDLVTPIQIVRHELRKTVGVICPHNRPAVALKRVASFVRPVRTGVLSASHLPETVDTPTGRVHRPLKW